MYNPGFIGRLEAFNLASQLFKGIKTFNLDDFQKAKPLRIYSESSAAIATTPQKVSFFSSADFAMGNIEAPGKLGNYYAIITDVRLAFYEATGVLGKADELEKLALFDMLSLEVEGQNFINKEPASMYVIGSGAAFKVPTSTAGTQGTFNSHLQTVHHDLIPVLPNQPISAWLEPYTTRLSAITTATYARLMLWGWKWNTVAAG